MHRRACVYAQHLAAVCIDFSLHEKVGWLVPSLGRTGQHAVHACRGPVRCAASYVGEASKLARSQPSPLCSGTCCYSCTRCCPTARQPRSHLHLGLPSAHLLSHACASLILTTPAPAPPRPGRKLPPSTAPAEDVVRYNSGKALYDKLWRADDLEARMKAQLEIVASRESGRRIANAFVLYVL